MSNNVASSTAIKAADTDDEAYEKDRLQKDAQAMNTMKEKAQEEFSKLRTPWKWEIRKRIWDLLEAKDIARPPRPVHHRIPNFDGAAHVGDESAKVISIGL
jgi:5-formyltetrahydrofolate cyclo-ligase